MLLLCSAFKQSVSNVNEQTAFCLIYKHSKKTLFHFAITVFARKCLHESSPDCIQISAFHCMSNCRDNPGIEFKLGYIVDFHVHALCQFSRAGPALPAASVSAACKEDCLISRQFQAIKYSTTVAIFDIDTMHRTGSVDT